MADSDCHTGRPHYNLTSESMDRALAAFLGVAVGDAMGMPSQTLSRAAIDHHYGTITQFVAPFENHPVSHGLSAAQITDDTEQSILLARRLISHPNSFSDEGWAQDLLNWEDGIRRRGLHDLLGPSTKRALESLQAGVSIHETGTQGTTNGAAMRIIPVAIATPPHSLARLVDQVECSCRLTHNTGEAIAAACAVAATISYCIDGATFEQAVPVALEAALLGSQRGSRVGVIDLPGRIRQALNLIDSGATLEQLAQQIGSSVASHESIPAAFGVVRLAAADPFRAAVLSANIGDDTDTIGAIATAMAASAIGKDSFSDSVRDRIITTNQLKLEPLVSALMCLRDDRQSVARHTKVRS